MLKRNEKKTKNINANLQTRNCISRIRSQIISVAIWQFFFCSMSFFMDFHSIRPILQHAPFTYLHMYSRSDEAANTNSIYILHTSLHFQFHARAKHIGAQSRYIVALSFGCVHQRIAHSKFHIKMNGKIWDEQWSKKMEATNEWNHI